MHPVKSTLPVLLLSFVFLPAAFGEAASFSGTAAPEMSATTPVVNVNAPAAEPSAPPPPVKSAEPSQMTQETARINDSMSGEQTNLTAAAEPAADSPTALTTTETLAAAPPANKTYTEPADAPVQLVPGAQIFAKQKEEDSKLWDSIPVRWKQGEGGLMIVSTDATNGQALKNPLDFRIWEKIELKDGTKALIRQGTLKYDPATGKVTVTYEYLPKFGQLQNLTYNLPPLPVEADKRPFWPVTALTTGKPVYVGDTIKGIRINPITEEPIDGIVLEINNYAGITYTVQYVDENGKTQILKIPANPKTLNA